MAGIKKYDQKYLGYINDHQLSELAQSLRNQIRYASRNKVGSQKIKLLQVEYCYVQNEINIRIARKDSFKRSVDADKF